ncbi:hypothetical protein BCR35DRAFT_335538 [Leucosporidium creatinivorum]|uniref:Uncharacterized protein n=1 Tax=Leucosporidium creatinivorum TaxID=106004 RepID=A0A1Y2D9P4_9BASI|nr:hypothetical protein BCR35DRAFT_335538 [Leucosporidium creatinivorum]
MSCTTSWITSTYSTVTVSPSWSYSYSSSVYTYNARARRSFEGESEPTPTPTILEFVPTGAPIAARQAPETTPAPTPAGDAPLNVGGPPTATATPVLPRDHSDAALYKRVSPASLRQIGGLDGDYCPISAPYRFDSAQCGQERCYTNPTLECTPTAGTSRFMSSGDCDSCYWYTPGLSITSMVGIYSVRPGAAPQVYTDYSSTSYPYYITSTLLSTSIYAGDVHCSSNKLSTGAIVGIAIGAAGLLGGVLAGLLAWFLLRRKPTPAPTSPETDASYTPAKLDQEFPSPAPSPLPLGNDGQFDSPESQGVFHREEPGTVVHW